MGQSEACPHAFCPTIRGFQPLLFLPPEIPTVDSRTNQPWLPIDVNASVNVKEGRTREEEEHPGPAASTDALGGLPCRFRKDFTWQMLHYAATARALVSKGCMPGG